MSFEKSAEWPLLIMKPTRLFLIELGEEDQLFSSFKARLMSSRKASYEFLEQKLTLPLAQSGGTEMFPFEANSDCALTLLALPAGQLGQHASWFFNLARSRNWTMPVVAVCRVAQPDDVEKLRQLGAADVWTTPFNPDRAIATLLRRGGTAGNDRSEIISLRARLGLGQLVGESQAFVAAIKQVPSIAKYQTCVLLIGETGTGKEVFAHAIHYSGARSDKPFIPVNCGAIPVDLLENEFFGHETGAFTSAGSASRGLLDEADGGTLFLDEVDSLPAMAQVKLLRFLQDGQFRPLGSQRICHSDVRVIAATNINLQEAVESGRFRKDLYYRLNVVTLKLPPLRERGDDVVLLARHFLAKFSAKFGAPTREFSSGALLKLVCHEWPGNVRELENVIQRAIVVADQKTIEARDICTDESNGPVGNQDFRNLKARAIAEFEQSYIRRLLAAHGGNITNAAQAAGKDRRAFWELMRKHRIGTKASSAIRVSPL
jgi:two-component system, NtrC family, response regulator GlrR